jgi:HipA-like protein
MTSASTKLLVMLMAGRRIGEVSTDRDGRLKLVYDDDWRVSDDATPVSLSMPLAQKAHDDPVRAFLWGLLPDSEQVLERWARTPYEHWTASFPPACSTGYVPMPSAAATPSPTNRDRGVPQVALTTWGTH